MNSNAKTQLTFARVAALPGPLPLGEGGRATAQDALGTLLLCETAKLGPPLAAMLPLPAGEGRGEGERCRPVELALVGQRLQPPCNKLRCVQACCFGAHACPFSSSPRPQIIHERT